MNYSKLFSQALVFGLIITIFNAAYNYKTNQSFNLMSSITFFSSIALIYFVLMLLFNKIKSKNKS